MAESILVTATHPEHDYFNDPLRQVLGAFVPNLVEISYLEANDSLNRIDAANAVYCSGVPANMEGIYDADTAKRIAKSSGWVERTYTDILGICVWEQVFAQLQGTRIVTDRPREQGEVVLKTTDPDNQLFRDLPPEFTVVMNHWAAVEETPTGYTLLGSTKDCEVAMIEGEHGRIVGTQFHPENNKYGVKILKNHFFQAVISGAREAA